MVSCRTWLQSLFPSRWGPLPSGILHRELHVSPQQSSLRGTHSPQGGWSAQDRGGAFLVSVGESGAGRCLCPKDFQSLQVPSESSFPLLSRGKLAGREADRSRRRRPSQPSPFLEDLSLCFASSQTHRLGTEKQSCQRIPLLPRLSECVYPVIHQALPPVLKGREEQM